MSDEHLTIVLKMPGRREARRWYRSTRAERRQAKRTGHIFDPGEFAADVKAIQRALSHCPHCHATDKGPAHQWAHVHERLASPLVGCQCRERKARRWVTRACW